MLSIKAGNILLFEFNEHLRIFRQLYMEHPLIYFIL